MLLEAISHIQGAPGSLSLMCNLERPDIDIKNCDWSFEVCYEWTRPD